MDAIGSSIPGTRAWLRAGTRVLSANGFNNVVAFVIVVAAARGLPVPEFGALGIAIAAIVLIASLGDAGTSIALVRLNNAVGLAAGSDHPTTGTVRALAAVTMAWKIALGALIVIGALVVGAPLMVACAAALLGAWTTLRAFDQARGAYDALGAQVAAYALLRLVCFGAVLAADALSVTTVLLALYVAPLAALLALRALGAGRQGAELPAWPDVAGAARALAGYAVWIGVSAACFVALARLPLFVLQARAEAVEIASYGAALTFMLAFGLLSEAFRTVTLPAVARATDDGARRTMRGALRRASVPLLAAALLVFVALTLAYRFVLGAPYSEAMEPWLILGAATLVTLAVGAQNLMLHAHGTPRLEAVINAARLAALGGVALLVPPTAAAMAAAFAIVCVGGELALYAALRARERGGPQAVEQAA